jgi:hypothetical protein
LRGKTNGKFFIAEWMEHRGHAAQYGFSGSVFGAFAAIPFEKMREKVCLKSLKQKI